MMLWLQYPSIPLGKPLANVREQSPFPFNGVPVPDRLPTNGSPKGLCPFSGGTPPQGETLKGDFALLSQNLPDREGGKKDIGLAGLFVRNDFKG